VGLKKKAKKNTLICFGENAWGRLGQPVPFAPRRRGQGNRTGRWPWARALTDPFCPWALSDWAFFPGYGIRRPESEKPSLGPLAGSMSRLGWPKAPCRGGPLGGSRPAAGTNMAIAKGVPFSRRRAWRQGAAGFAISRRLFKPKSVTKPRHRRTRQG
jgi:hypothetical protein